jgi:hypothetical protein
MIETIDLYDPENVATELALRRAQVKELRAALEAVEYVGGDGPARWCAWCHIMEGYGHTDDCQRETTLAHTKEPG